MDPKKRLFILIGGLVLVVVILLLSLTRIGRITPVGKVVPAGEGVFQCGDQITYQGDTYNTVRIGEQCWMKENLKTTEYRDGTPISNLITNTDWAADREGAYVCYQNAKENCNTSGALYNWYAVSNKAGLCPQGWSVPTHNQWTDLERSVCHNLGYDNCETEFAYNDSMGWRGKDEGRHLKSTTSKGLDTYGFAALLGGFRNPNGPFSFLGEKGFWWTSTPSEEFAFGRIMDTDNQGVRRVESIKSSGFSVRCVQD